jgi:hypothetical protein
MMLAVNQELVLVLLLMQLLLHTLALQAAGVGVQAASSRSTRPSQASFQVHMLARNRCCGISALC